MGHLHFLMLIDFSNNTCSWVNFSKLTMADNIWLTWTGGRCILTDLISLKGECQVVQYDKTCIREKNTLCSHLFCEAISCFVSHGKDADRGIVWSWYDTDCDFFFNRNCLYAFQIKNKLIKCVEIQSHNFKPLQTWDYRPVELLYPNMLW